MDAFFWLGTLLIKLMFVSGIFGLSLAVLFFLVVLYNASHGGKYYVN